LNKPLGKYESARAVGGVGCLGCTVAELLQPVNRYYILTTDSVLVDTALAELQNYVIQAELNGGGWVPLVFHAVCDDCSDYSMTAQTLTNFLTWLKARESQGTYVRTVHQVMSGNYPPPPPPPPLGPNLIINPSLEVLGANNLPDCWQIGDWGSSAGTWTRTTDAYTGGFAEQLWMTAYNNGDRKIMPTMDYGQNAGGCAPAVEAGENYQLGAYYKSTIPSIMVLFYLDANDNWQYLLDGANLPASTDWAKMNYRTGLLPTGAKAVSFGIALQDVGTLITDEYSMAKVLDNPPANTAPTFVDGTTALTVAMNSAAVDLKPNLHVSDTDSGQTETWSQGVAPAHGTLVFTGAAAASGSANITPGGIITYQPEAGYSGADSFTVQVSDGAAGATRTFNITINAAAPAVTSAAASGIVATGAVLNGSANPNGVAATGWFRYGTVNPGTCNDSFGTRSPSAGGVGLGSGNAAVAFARTLTGLTASTTYYFCAIGNNAAGTAFGGVLSFATPPVPAGGALSGTGTSSAAAANLTTEGTLDWLHWGETSLTRKSGVTAQLTTYTVIGGGAATRYTNDPRPLSWTGGTPTATGANNKNGVFVWNFGAGFSFTAPASTTTRTLTVRVGGWNSGGTLVARLSDGSAADFVNVTSAAAGQYDRNYVLSYKAAAGAGKTLTVSWTMSSGAGNVTVNSAALK
jgi:VCBS repeat-containing protein